MDPAKYKTVLTTRGFTYNYYFAAAATPSKPTILFCHGFPSTSSHWRREALFFEERGYGVVVPDMLGYGGTSKPTDTDDYLPSKVSRDIIDILDAEAIGKAIAVGHDWGSTAVSRLANHFPERFLAYAFFAVPYVPVRPPAPYEQLLALSKAKYGYELYGYWEYLASDEFETDFRAHPDAFVNILFPSDPNIWKTHMAPRGLLQKSMQDNYSAPLAQYITEEDKKETIAGFLENGFRGPTRWYDVLITNKAAKDNIATIPEQRRFPPVTAPIFFGAAKHDKASVPQQGYDVFASPPFKNHSVTLREFDGDHWIILSCAEEINRELLRWIEESVVATSLKASL
ncbi:Alpha/Beta hydrolase protein [Irpex rosettiformis]|uniref:Alpha/Beta hydrolase protein n=1 Tax=Irpex rosettiformis TaxID=378272 RepID=A0ACB8UGC6_9APHY|nr:Alpha/Beta hydrolase protein [Irpex rosettiformis]